MSMEQRYRSALRGKEPSPRWRRQTLAAMEGAKGRKAPPRRALRTAAVAAAAAVAFTGGVWLTARYLPSDPDGPGVARTPEPVSTPSPTPDPAIWMESFVIVMESRQAMVEDPLEGLEAPEELPVYENPVPGWFQQRDLLERLGEALGFSFTITSWTESSGDTDQGRAPCMIAECSDGALLHLYGYSRLVIFDPPDPDALEERLRDYLAFQVQLDSSRQPDLWEYRDTTQEVFNYNGTGLVLATTSILDRSRDGAGRLYDDAFLCFHRQDTDIFTLILPPSAGEAASCPIRPQEDAVAAFRSGDYWGGHFTAHPEEAEILQVTLQYDISDDQRWFQPVYRILFTQEDWDMADWMSGVDPELYMGVGIAYVPAVDPEYQDQIPYQRFFNDGLAHHTPEDLK